MCRKHCADTRNKAGAEIIPRFYCNIHPAEKQCKENNNQYRTADESDRLRYAAEYEIRVPCRNIAKLCQRLLTEKALAREPSGTYCHLRLSDMVLCIVACGGRIQKNIDSVALLRGQNKKVHQRKSYPGSDSGKDYINPLYLRNEECHNHDNKQYNRRSVIRLENYQHERNECYAESNHNVLEFQQSPVPVHCGRDVF